MRKTIYRPEYRALVDALRGLREKLGVSQTELAKQLDWPQQRVSAMEAGARRLDVLEYLQLAEALGLKDKTALELALGSLRGEIKKPQRRR